MKQTFVATHSSDGVNTQGKYLRRHKVLPGGCAAGTLKLAYTNHCSEAGGFNSITVACRIRYPAGYGTWYNATFASAGSIVLTAAGADGWTDAIAGHPDMAAGDFYDEEAYVTVASAGMKWPTIDNMALKGANGEGLLLSTSDISGSTPTPADSGATEIYGAVASVGMSTATRAIAIFGDSIANGAQDDGTGDASGFIERKFNGTYPVLNLATSSERASQFVTAHSRRVTLMLASGITDFVIAMGSNDVANGATYATALGDLLSMIGYLASFGRAITILPILAKGAGSLNPTTGFTVGGIADQLNAVLLGDMGLASAQWDTRVGWQNMSTNVILSGTYTDDNTHPNAVGNAAIAASGGAASTLIAASVPAAAVPSAYFTANYTYFRAADLGTAGLVDTNQITTWVDTKAALTMTWAGEKPKYRTNMTTQGKPAVKFDIAGTGLEKLVIPHAAAVDNIFGSAGIIITAARYATAGGNGTGRLWTKGVGETEAMTTATNLRATIDYVTADVAMNGTTAANTWYIRAVDCTVGNVGSLRQNSENTVTASGTGTGGHVDNSASDFILGNHDTLGRGWDGDVAGIAFSKNPGTLEQQLCAQAYIRADTGVTII